MKLKQFMLLTSALSGLIYASSGMAQTTTDTDKKASDKDQKEVVVVGIRKSIQKSIDMKRKNAAQVDVITAEDVSKFPDTNAAEALSRVPGVTVDYSQDGGEGNHIAILGMDSRLINVSMNGNSIASSTVGIANQNSGRDFNFANLATDMIGNVEVYKSSQAKLDEGQIGGTVNVDTRKPLDTPANTLSLNLSYNKNLRTEDSEPKGTLFYSWHDTNKRFGILASVSYNKLTLGGTSISVLSGYEDACQASNMISSMGGCTTDANGNTYAGSHFITPSDLPKVTSGPALTPQSLMPRNLNSGSFIQTEERLTYQTMLQWRPTDDLELNLFGYYVDANDSSYSQAVLSDVGVTWDDSNGYNAVQPALLANGQKNPNAGNQNFPTTISSVTTNQYGVTGGTLSNLTVREDLQYNHQILKTHSINFEAKWTPENWKIDFNMGNTSATGGANPEYYLSFYGHTSGSWALSPSTSYLQTADPLTDPSLFTTRSTGQQAGFVKVAVTDDAIKYAKLDAQRDVDWGWVNKIEFGYKYMSHENYDFSHFYNTNVSQTGSMANFNTLTTPSSLVKGLGASGQLTSYAYLSQQAMIDYSVANRNPGFSAGNPYGDYTNTGADWNDVEKDQAAYVQADFRSGKFHGDAGVRFVETDVKETYFAQQNYYPWIGDWQTSEHKYNDILPAVNTVYDLADDMDLRFTVAKVMQRPSFADQAGQVNYSTSTNPVQGSGGNPHLNPYRATNWGASYEWYFAKNSIFSVDAFLRDVQSYIVYKNVWTNIPVTPAAVNYCNTLSNGCAVTNWTNPMPILLNTPFNGSKAKVPGVSVDYQGDIAYGFGIQTNVTWLDQHYSAYIDANNPGGQVYPMPFLSKWSLTVAPYYEKGPIQAHLSYTWRSQYTTQVESEQSQPQFQAPFGQLSGSFTYKVNSHLDLNMSGVNLLDPLVKINTTGNLPVSWQKYGTRIMAGLTYKFN